MKIALHFDGIEEQPDWLIELANLPSCGQLIEIAPKRIVEVLEVLEPEPSGEVVARVREIVE